MKPIDAVFGIHLVNRVTPTVIVPGELWEMYRTELESVPASIFVVDSVSSGDLAFALSYIRLLERSHGGGVYVLQASDSKPSQKQRMVAEEAFLHVSHG